MVRIMNSPKYILSEVDLKVIIPKSKKRESSARNTMLSFVAKLLEMNSAKKL